MPRVYTITIQVPDDYKGFGDSVEDAKLNLLHRWIGFAENPHVYNDLLADLRRATNMDEINTVANKTYESKILCGALNEWFMQYHSAKCEESKTDLDKYTTFQDMVRELVMNSRFGDRFRQLVFNGNHHAEIIGVQSSDYVDVSKVEVVGVPADIPLYAGNTIKDAEKS